MFQTIEKHYVHSPLPRTVSLQVPIVTKSNSFNETQHDDRQHSEELAIVDKNVDNNVASSAAVVDVVEAEKPKKSGSVVQMSTRISTPSSDVKKSASDQVVSEPQKPKKLLPRHLRDSRSRSKSPMPTTTTPTPALPRCVDANQTFDDTDVPDGTKVFAKWVERTEVRYWPGKKVARIVFCST